MGAKKSITFIILIFLAFNLSAQWAQLPGPVGGSINSITGYGNNVFAGTVKAGVFHSPAQGLFWNKANNGLPVNCNARSLAIKISDIYAGTNLGVYKSDDNGLTWNQITFFGSNNIRHVNVIDSAIYVSTLNTGIYKSINNGNTWNFISNGIQSSDYTISITKHGNDFFAGTAFNGIYKSVNGDSNWTASNTGLGNGFVYSIVSVGQNLFAGTSDGVYTSDNGGANWLLSGISSDTYSLCLSGSYLFAGTIDGVFRYDTSTGTTGSWTTVNNGFPIYRTNSLYSLGGILIAGTANDGVYYSTNNGNSWSESNPGLTALGINELHISGTKLMAAANGLYYSNDGGNTWVNYNLGNTFPFPAGSASIKESSTHLIASINTVSLHSVGFSDDGGNTWNMTVNGLPGYSIYKLLALGQFTFVTSSSSMTGLYRTTDNGMNWTVANNGIANHTVNSLAADGMNIYAATGVSTSGALYKSSNFGQSWTAIGANLFTSALTSVKAFNDTIVAGAADGKIYLSTNGGIQWNLAGPGIAATSRINDILTEGNLIIAATRDGIYISNNFGTTWYTYNDGLTTTDMSCLLKIGNTVYAGTYGGSIYYHSALLTNIKELVSEPVVSIYPNPVNSELKYISVVADKLKADATFILLNASGQMVYSEILKSNNSTVLLPDLPSGLYFIRITNSHFNYNRKLVIN